VGTFANTVLWELCQKLLSALLNGDVQLEQDGGSFKRMLPRNLPVLEGFPGDFFDKH